MSSRITLLPDHVANQIAAGEVIQRPASVAKELLENAVDAGANSIQLIIKDAGKTLIQVIDNGIGMDSTDIRLAFERHATSKIKVAEDLFDLATKGFRGEALASIAAIAHVETHTKTENDEVSHCLKIEGSKVVEQTISTQPQGTSIAVKRLFYNIPARRNFLKSDTVELRHVIDEFHRVALAHPEIKFTFYNNGSELFDLPVDSLRKRIATVFGAKWENQLVPVEEKTSLVGLNGFIVKPIFAKKTRGQQFFFVNNRFIKSPFLHHAVTSAFEGLIKPGFHPGYFLYLIVDPKSIDINIHPTKTEVKFEEEQNLYAIIRASVKHSLGVFQVAPPLDFDKDPTMDLPYAYKNRTPNLPPIEVDSSFNPFKGEGNLFAKKIAPPAQWESLFTENIVEPPIEETLMPLLDVPQASRVFQLFSKYIVCPLKSQLLLINQTRAHQRILYERFLNAITNRKGQSQQLLFPQTMTLSPLQLEHFKQLHDIIEDLGFQVNLLGQQLEISGAPISCPVSKVTNTLETLLEEIDESSDSHFSQADQIAKALAKALAIKTGDVLQQEEQQALIDDFFGCKETVVSPFNRQIFITLDKTELDKKLNG
ncbi:MAG: DNA mismatch repair endonuclease MutL [Flavobacteriia bacterium]|nr:DNA mismatch repair endonuclease MutL [Flavobacteriia bacterium]